MRSRTIDAGDRIDSPPDARPLRRVRPWYRRRWLLALAPLAALLAVAWIYGVDEPLRRHLEKRLNASLAGYTVTIGALDLHPIGLSLDLEEVTVVQNASPEPPLVFPRWTTSVQWRALLSGALVADTEIVGPKVFLTFDQAAREARDDVSMRDRGWQDAVTSVYPLEINRLRIEGGEVHYFEAGAPIPVHLTAIDFRADDIRNVRSAKGELPSPFSLSALWANEAAIAIDGRADFLAEPEPAAHATFSVEGFSLAPLDAVSRHADVRIRRGTLATRGEVELTSRRRLEVKTLSVANAAIEYVEPRPVEEGSPPLEKATRAATVPAARPAFAVDVGEAKVSKSSFAFVRARSEPPYRFFLDATELEVRGFSNQRDRRKGTAKLRAAPMGSGTLRIDAQFAGGAERPDFSLDLRLEDLELRTLNDFLRAENGIDVNDGKLAVYSEIAVRDGRIDGYVKPLLSDVDVYDGEQDKEDNPLRKLYEAVVGGASTLLENRSRDEVATRTDLSGPIESPETSALEIVLGLLQNAFFRAILPGLERHAEESR